MAFTVDDVRDLVRLLDERPEWRAEVRRQLLSDEFLAMPEQLAALRLEVQRLDKKIAEQQLETARRFQQVEDQIAALTRTVDTLRDDVGELKGDSLERRYREKAGAYFGRLIRRAHVLTDSELNALLDDAVERGVLTDDESDEVTWADAVVRGRRRGDRAEVVAVAEVSWGVGVKDVERASRRAGLLAKLGFTALPVVGGKAVTREAADLARQQGVWQLFDGRLVSPDEDAEAG